MMPAVAPQDVLDHAYAVRWARPAITELVATIAELVRAEYLLVVCPNCQASWHGYDGDPCDWCAAALQRQLEDQRQRLLYPDWMTTQGLAYDQLSDVDKTVWDRTRGTVNGETSIAAWANRIIDAVQAGVITEPEADAATSRAERWAT